MGTGALSTVVSCGVGGLVGGLIVWFTFARQLTTRDEVGTMIHERVSPLADRAERLERVTEDIQHSLVELRVLAAKLTVLLETRGRAE